MKKNIVYIFIIVVFISLLFIWQKGGLSIFSKTDYGCDKALGYEYSEKVGACIKVLDMTPDIMEASKLAVDSFGKEFGLTVVSFNSYEEFGAYDIILEHGKNREVKTIYIRNGKVVSKPE